MIDAWTIKEWLLVALTINVVLFAVVIFLQVKIISFLARLFTESELVQFLRQFQFSVQKKE